MLRSGLSLVLLIAIGVPTAVLGGDGDEAMLLIGAAYFAMVAVVEGVVLRAVVP